MKSGADLMDIAQRLTQQREQAADLLVKEPAIRMEIEEDGDTLVPVLAVPENPTVQPTDLAHRQIGTHLGIPAPYYDRCLEESPELLARNVNHWLAERPDGVRMLRTLQPPQQPATLRAFLSDRYRPLDNFDLAQAVLPELESGGFTMRSHQLTETHFYVKAIAQERTADVKVGDTVAIGVSIRNSDVGCSSLSVSPFVERLICTNGMTINDLGQRRRHVGKRNNGFESHELVTEHLSTEAHAASDKAFWLTVRDTVRACTSEATLTSVTESMRKGAEIRATGHPAEVVRKISRKVGITETEESGVLEHLVTGGDLSAWGIANAVTRTAEDVDSYDRASELESIGWKVLNLPANDFAAA